MARGTTVNLSWHQPPEPGAAVTEWAVSRNGVPHAVVYQPGLIDTPGMPGVYTYSVTAMTEDDRRSQPSVDARVVVHGRLHRWFINERGRPRIVVWLVAAFLLFSFVLGFFVAANPVTAPTNVRVLSSDPVTLQWDGVSTWTPLKDWEVYRDGKFLGRTKEPMWTDPEALTSTSRYTIRAVSTSGKDTASTTITVGPPATTTP